MDYQPSYGFLKDCLYRSESYKVTLADAYGKFATTACGDTGVAQRGASATRAAMVLSELFERADKRAGELAVAYDRARIAGLACERSYQSLTSIHLGKAE